MGVSEKTIENNIKKFLDKHNAYHVKIHGSAFMPAGTPDILACVGGRFVGIEVKKQTGGIVSKLQEFKIKQIHEAGGVAFVARSVEDVERELSRQHII